MHKKMRHTAALASAQADQRTFNGPTLPVELIHEIIDLAFGAFYHDLLLHPESLGKWDAGMIFLQVSRMFRDRAVRFLKPLWGGVFPVGRTSDYKKIMSFLRRWSEHVNAPPNPLQRHRPPPPFLNDRSIRSPLLPIVHIFKCLILLRALERGHIDSLEDPEVAGDINVVLQNMVDNLRLLPDNIREAAFWPLREFIADHGLLWARAITLAGVLHILEDFFLDLKEFDWFEEGDEDILMGIPETSLGIAEHVDATTHATAALFALPPSAATPSILDGTPVIEIYDWLKLSSVLHTAASVSIFVARAVRKSWQVFVVLFSPSDRAKLMSNYNLETGEWLTTESGAKVLVDNGNWHLTAVP